MKKKLLSLALTLSLLLSSLSLWSCDDGIAPPPETVTGEYSRITVEANCSIEILADNKGKTLSVSPLDDEAAVLLVGEASFVGLSAEEAVERIVNIAADTGYLIHGAAEESDNTLRLSVSGDSDYAEKLYDSAKKKASGVMVSHGISGRIERVSSMDVKALRDLTQGATLLTKEEVDGLNDQELYQALAEGRAETAGLLTQDLRDAYLQAKRNEMAFAEREETAKVIESLGAPHSETHDAYTAALEKYESAATALEDYRYEMLVAPDSIYQQALALLRDKKAEILEQKGLIAALGADSEAMEEALSALEKKEEAYKTALLALTALGENAATAIVGLISSLQGAEASLQGIENALDGDVKAALEAKAAQIEAGLKKRSESFAAAFRAEYGEDIAAAEESLKAYKEALIAATNENK